MENLVRCSFKPVNYRVNTTPTGNNKQIQWGDKIFVRVRPTSFGQGEGIEFTSFDMTDMTSIVGEIRHRLRSEHGLWMVYVRNVSRGWSIERPIKLYRKQSTGSGWLAEELAKNIEKSSEEVSRSAADSQINESLIASYV